MDKEDNAEEGRILSSRRVNYIINEKKTKKKTNSNKEDNQVMQRGIITDEDRER